MSQRVTKTHLDLLQQFGKAKRSFGRATTDRDIDHAWLAYLQGFEQQSQSPIAKIPYDEVVDAWQRMVSGASRDTQIAMSLAPDPAWISIGVAYRKKLVAAHTTRMGSHLFHVMRHLLHSFEGDAERFHAEVDTIARRVVERQRKASDGESS